MSYNYTYDPIYRLTQATPTGGSQQLEAYTYDQVGNRLTGANEQQPNANEAIIYSYDDENRLTGVEITKQDGSGMRRTYAFAYDPFGKRISKTLVRDEIGTACDSPNVCPRTTNYVYDQENIILEYQNGNIIARYTQGLGIDEPLALEIKTGETFTPYYYHADGLGSITALTNASGTIVQTYSYDSFGNMTATGSISQPFTYTAREYDTETGLYFYRARYYDAKAGRFVTKDPIGFEGNDINLYSYVGNNPINFTDPYGLRFRAPRPPSGEDLWPWAKGAPRNAEQEGCTSSIEKFCDPCDASNCHYEVVTKCCGAFSGCKWTRPYKDTTPTTPCYKNCPTK